MKKNKTKKEDLKCDVCGKPASHSVTVELRERQGPAELTRVLHLCCEEHSKNTNLSYWIEMRYWLKLVSDLRNKGIFIKKEYCNIHMVKLN